MGFTQDYSHIPDWTEKPEGYQADAMVKYEGNVFIANYKASLNKFESDLVDGVDAILTDVVLTGHDYGTYISIPLGGATDYVFFPKTINLSITKARFR